jgi:hypothetical protein
MIVASAAQAAQDKFRVDSHGAGAWIHPYFGTGAKAIGTSKPATGSPLPMLYLVEQDPNTSIPTHFHQVTQFQVAVAGHGKLGEHALRPVTVHYTNAFTGYGPLQASSEGMSYFTVRNAFDPGLRALPEAKQELLDARKTPAGSQPLNIIAKPWTRFESLDKTASQQLLTHDSGASAWIHSYQTGANLTVAPMPQDRVWILIAGDAQIDARQATQAHDLQAWDGLFLASQETLDLRAGVAGMQILELRFPGHSHF